MIHVCFCLHDKTGRYAKFTGTAMMSVFENTNGKVTAHILHDNSLSADDREKFSYLAGQYDQRVKFYNVAELCADKLDYIQQTFADASESRYSIAMFYRFLIPQIFPANIEKIIYLDSDIIVNLDIKELWRIDLEDKPLAAANESEIDAERLKLTLDFKYLIKQNLVDYDDYFNSGVLLMNLNFLRNDEENINRGLQFLSENPQMIWPDQDVLNYLYAGNYVKLAEKFDVFVDVERSKSAEVRPAIYHYAVEALTLNMRDPHNRLWMDYFILTPWFDAEAIGRIYIGVQQLHAELKTAMVQVSTVMSGKTRAFFADPDDFDALKEIFYVRDDEQIIRAESEDSLKKLLNAMKKSRGKKVFFIMIPNFPFQTLVDAGFEPGKDFVNGLEFLSDEQGMPLNSHPMIQAL